MTNKASKISQADAASAMEAATALAKRRLTVLATSEIDNVSGGLKVVEMPTDPGITAGLISPDVLP